MVGLVYLETYVVLSNVMDCFRRILFSQVRTGRKSRSEQGSFSCYTRIQSLTVACSVIAGSCALHIKDNREVGGYQNRVRLGGPLRGLPIAAYMAHMNGPPCTRWKRGTAYTNGYRPSSHNFLHRCLPGHFVAPETSDLVNIFKR